MTMAKHSKNGRNTLEKTQSRLDKEQRWRDEFDMDFKIVKCRGCGNRAEYRIFPKYYHPRNGLCRPCDVKWLEDNPEEHIERRDV